VVLNRISALVRSGLVAAKYIPIGPASSPTRIAVLSEPTPSSTAANSSAYDSQGGRWSSGAGSEAPVPKRSNRISRENAVNLRYISAAAGSSHMVSTWVKLPGVATRSGGPCPSTW
jgi:hypothetical protein